ncbi:MmcQ/YjbR family DNA-binding protein [Chromobacterium paludis]|uniref:MmcQ/YjbR family DNA-binding protein n=1 Tax=Chromobacterium paludis TaxID=2605945 RepID=A0A5C1DKX7_9NEIS|nr:MmcQ/YjbR family DNA-binding protein [Chromobacterium paludis]QEL57302.1 MmcQ/YjbR family DNA-binding protein [Chromobacterium paludis]
MPLPAALLDELLAHACALPGAAFDVKWGGQRVVSIGGKMFLVCGGDALSYKVDDEDFLPLSGLPGARPAPYLARARWIQVSDTEALSPDALRQGIARSRELVLQKLPKAQRAWP